MAKSEDLRQGSAGIGCCDKKIFSTVAWRQSSTRRESGAALMDEAGEKIRFGSRIPPYSSSEFRAGRE
jgi:hypothetical protein